MKLNKELLAKAKATKTAGELRELAAENGMHLSDEQVEKAFVKLHEAGELADEELNNVSGGYRVEDCCDTVLMP